MAVEKKEREGPATSLVRVCPSCNKKAHISRRYCDCHADLRDAGVALSADPPEIAPCNFEAPGLCCGDCPADCAYCASFAETKMNSAGFGGEKCRHRNTGTARCYCCQFQVKLSERLRGLAFTEMMDELRKEKPALETANLFTRSAAAIYGMMTQHILARIQREEERAV